MGFLSIYEIILGKFYHSLGVFFYFIKNLKNVYHINETQEYFSYRSNFGCYITQHFNCISWKYEFLINFPFAVRNYIILWLLEHPLGSFVYPLGILWVPLCFFRFLWVIRRAALRGFPLKIFPSFPILVRETRETYLGKLEWIKHFFQW